MGTVLDLSVVLIILAFVGTGARRGLIMTVERFVSFAGSLIGAHLGATFFKGILASKLILPWLSERVSNSGYNPSAEILNGVGAAGGEIEQELMRILESAGIPGFSLSHIWGELIDGLTGTGTEILNTAETVVAERISYVMLFILLYLVIQLAALILFSSIDGLKHLPLLGTVNRLGGGAAGFLMGLTVVCILMAAIPMIFPKTAAPGAFLSRDVISGTHAARKVYGIVKTIIP